MLDRIKDRLGLLMAISKGNNNSNGRKVPQRKDNCRIKTSRLGVLNSLALRSKTTMPI